MSNKVYVGNLPYSFTNDDLKNLFAAYAAVRAAEVILDRMTNRSRGFGFVELESIDGVQQAIQNLHDTELQGRKLQVTEARDRAPGGMRSSSGPRSGGGGYGGPRAGGGGHNGPRAGGGGFGAPRAPGGFGPPRHEGGGGGFRGGGGRSGAQRGGRPKPEDSDRWSDGGGRRRRNDRDFGED